MKLSNGSKDMLRLSDAMSSYVCLFLEDLWKAVCREGENEARAKGHD